jgi:hypothetical protein
MLHVTELSKGQIRYYRINARVVAQAIEIVAVYRAKNRIKVRYIGDRKPFMLDLTLLADHGGAIEE